MVPPRLYLTARRLARGFTLIELIMVLLLVGILAIFVLPRLDLTRGFDEVGHRDALRSTLEFARKAAVSQRRNVRVTLAGNNLSLSIDNDNPEGAAAGTFPRNLALPVPDRHCAGPVNQLCAPSGITVAGPATLTFSPLGRASATTYNYTVTGLAAFTLTVEAETGHVH